MMATPKYREAYFNTVHAELRVPAMDVYEGLKDQLDRVGIVFFLDVDQSLSEPELMMLKGRRTYRGEQEIAGYAEKLQQKRAA